MIFLKAERARLVCGALMALTLSACASAETVDTETRGTPSESKVDREVTRPTTPKDPQSDASKGRDAGMSNLPVSPEAAACAAGLPFKPTGCGCEEEGETLPCWTGKPSDRYRGQCADGRQKCELHGDGEFQSLTWGTCEGEVTDCGEPAAPEEKCGCVPGVTIACDEDCATLVICTLTGTKTCQPDGTWGPCREQLWTGNINPEVVLGCRNFFHGCLPFAPEGAYVGDCSKQFECGHAPGQPATPGIQ